MIFYACNTLLVCVNRHYNGADIATPLDNQGGYKEWPGCFTQLPMYYTFGNKETHYQGRPTIRPFTLDGFCYDY